MEIVFVLYKKIYTSQIEFAMSTTISQSEAQTEDDLKAVEVSSGSLEDKITNLQIEAKSMDGPSKTEPRLTLSKVAKKVSDSSFVSKNYGGCFQ
jgi:hypothetical protein